MDADLYKLTARRALTERAARKFGNGLEAGTFADGVAVEAPLEIRVAGDTVAVTLRTPGDDSALTLGFLYAEGILAGIEDVGSLYPCGHPDSPDFGNVYEVLPAAGANLDIERTASARRGTLTTSACGVCGRQSIEDLLLRCRPVPPSDGVPLSDVLAVPERLRAKQPLFARTGGTHAAGIWDAEGNLLAHFEDVGRHNAVDKAVGSLILEGRVGRYPNPSLAAPVLLGVSGRASFEILQKAAMARISVVASVSAASSLAIDLAERLNVTLASFVRGGQCTVYTHPERLVFRSTLNG